MADLKAACAAVVEYFDEMLNKTYSGPATAMLQAELNNPQTSEMTKNAIDIVEDTLKDEMVDDVVGVPEEQQ